MPIPSTRAELITQVSDAFGKLQRELEGAGSQVAEILCVDDWRVKDVLAVRAWWTHAVVDWVEAGRHAQPVDLPAPGYRWTETPRLNEDIVSASSDESYDSILDQLERGFERVLPCIDSLADSELLEVGAFEWAGKWPLSRWISINTARQYSTARTYIRRSIKLRGGS